MACAQCHTHKYDPITQTEYFQVYAIFNQTADADKRDESPLYEIIEEPLRRQRDEWNNEIAELEKLLGKSKKEWLDGFQEWLDKKPTLPNNSLKEALALEPEKRTAKQTQSLEEHYIRNVSPATKSERDQLTTLKNQLSKTKPVTIPVMKELEPDKQRKNLRSTARQLASFRRTSGPRGSNEHSLASIEFFVESTGAGSMVDGPEKSAIRPCRCQPHVGSSFRYWDCTKQRRVWQPRRSTGTSRVA